MKQNERCSAIMARDDGQLPDIAGICNLDTQSWVSVSFFDLQVKMLS